MHFLVSSWPVSTVLDSDLVMDAAPGQLRDIHGPIQIDGSLPFLWTAILLILIAAAWWAWHYYRRPVSLGVASAVAPQDPLSSLLVEYREGACTGAHFLLRLDPLLRQSIAASADIPALQLSSQELRIAMSERLGRNGTDGLRHLLELLDRVKFAGYIPKSGETDWVVENVVQLLDVISAGAVA